MNAVYLFSNASIQGTVRVGQVLKTKKGKAIATSMFAAGFLQGILNSLIDDEEYEKIPEFVKETSWILMLGDGKYLSIPMPYGFNIFPSVGNAFAELYLGKISTTDAIKRTLKSTEGAINPMGSSPSTLQLISPTPTDPIVQILENRSFSDIPIKPEQPPYGARVPESTLYYESVNPYTKEFAEWLNEITGGSEKYSGFIDFSPEILDHLVDSYGGGLYKEIKNTFISGTNLINGEIPNLRNIPILRRFVGEVSDKATLSKIFEMLKESGRTKYSADEKRRFYKYLNQARKDKVIDNDKYGKYRKDFTKNQSSKSATLELKSWKSNNKLQLK
jgi:hypothetical protein